MYIINFIRGFCMALADSVPGVSGGTVAFILGFYNKFINSINNVISGNKNSKKEGIMFIFKIGIGWIFGMGLSMIFLSSVFEKEIYKISSVFVGFIISSIPLIIREEKKFIIGKYRNILFLIMGIAVVGLLSYFNPVGDIGVNLDKEFTFGFLIYVFASGMIAISAMVLPGISGSTILLILGLYTTIISAIKNIIMLDFTYLPMILIFCLGVITGLVLTVRVIKNLLINYRSQTIYTIIGLMIGSIYSIFKGPESLSTPKPSMDINTFSISFFILGIGIMIFLQLIRIYFEKNKGYKTTDK